LNFPLHDGIDDTSFEEIFKAVISKVMETYQPSAIVLQCGADSLSGDRLGCFNLTLKGHGACVDFVKKLNVPLLVLGGGGYTVRNVARCWAYETGILLDTKLPEEIPYNDYYEYYGPDFQLHITPSNMQNLNTSKYLDEHKIQLFEILRQLPAAPSVQYSTKIPHEMEIEEPEREQDVRISKRDEDKHIDDEREFYEDDHDNDNRRNHNEGIDNDPSLDGISAADAAEEGIDNEAHADAGNLDSGQSPAAADMDNGADSVESAGNDAAAAEPMSADVQPKPEIVDTPTAMELQ